MGKAKHEKGFCASFSLAISKRSIVRSSLSLYKRTDLSIQQYEMIPRHNYCSWNLRQCFSSTKKEVRKRISSKYSYSIFSKKTCQTCSNMPIVLYNTYGLLMFATYIYILQRGLFPFFSLHLPRENGPCQNWVKYFRVLGCGHLRNS